MAAQIGLDMLLKVDSDGAGTYLTIGGAQVISCVLNRQTVDITSQDNVDRWRNLLGGAGVASVQIRANGVFKDNAADAQARTYFFGDNANRNWQVIIPSFYSFTGPFVVSNLEYGMNHDGEVTYSYTIESAGTITPVAL